MGFYKRWWFWAIIILGLLILFFPKSCGGGGGIGGPVTLIDCSCIGIKGPSLFVLLGGRIMDAFPTSCYGICLKSTCKTTIIYPNGIDYNCKNNGDCVSQCSRGCVNTNWAESNSDNSECLRAWDCSCNNNLCYTDGKPPPKY